MSSRRNALCVSVVYLAAMILLSGVRPLWLDEILQLLDTRQPSPAILVAQLPNHHVGGTPLGLLTQQFSLSLSGYSLRNARLPAAIFGGATVLATALLGIELGLGTGWILMVFPIAVRYSTEGRVYSQALFFSVLATLLYVRLSKRPNRWLAAAYTLTLVAAAYTQPYSASVGLAHVLWSALCRDRKTVTIGLAGLGTTMVSFLPWYCWSHTKWATGIASSGLQFSATVKTPLMLFREFSGAGYWGSGLLLALCLLAIAGRRPLDQAHLLLLLLAAVPAVLVFAADAWFGYFLAARQFVWILPAIAILAESAGRRNLAGQALLTLLVAVCIWQTMRFFHAPHEDWQAAANAVQVRTQQGACLAVAPPEQAALYEYFQPGLRAARCNRSELVLAITPYSTTEQRTAAMTDAQSSGYQAIRATIIGGTTIIGFRRKMP